MNSKRLQTAVLIGCLLGVTVPFGAMAISHRPADAAIFVIDEKNIAEAVKTAITTAEILTTEQQELAFKLLDAKKLDLKIICAAWDSVPAYSTSTRASNPSSWTRSARSSPC